MKKQAGFTVFELVVVLLLFGILWLVQLFAYGFLRKQFMATYEKNIASSVQVGIVNYFVDPKRGDLKSYPPSLDREDPGLCSAKKPCFQNVLTGGITTLWQKNSAMKYRGPGENGHQWKYDPAQGHFGIIREA